MIKNILLYLGLSLLHPLEHWLKSVDLRLQLERRKVKLQPGDFNHCNTFRVLDKSMVVDMICKYLFVEGGRKVKGFTLQAF